jgi:hypothetical protein
LQKPFSSSLLGHFLILWYNKIQIYKTPNPGNNRILGFLLAVDEDKATQKKGKEEMPRQAILALFPGCNTCSTSSYIIRARWSGRNQILEIGLGQNALYFNNNISLGDSCYSAV